MKILKNLEVPTGNICIVKGDRGKLELVSLGDYGKSKNIKADFLGLKRTIKKVEHCKIMPLEKKWVVTVSSQYGCSMGCLFCDVPLVGKGLNATENDLVNQVKTAMSLHPEIKRCERLNIHYARMGEPTFNRNIIGATMIIIREYNNTHLIHPVISTMFPNKNKNIAEFINDWVMIKNIVLKGEAGLQISINSTEEKERSRIFNKNACTIPDISKIMDRFRPIGRKFTLNFPIADFTINAEVIAKYFSPEKYMIKLTPMHKSITALKNKIKTKGDYTTIYPYTKIEKDFKKYGFDVLVFLASWHEDMSRITCGNAILSGSKPDTNYRIVHI